ncbi:MAG: DUF4097 family beta strand repeat-containing protein [Christiangramia sp.]|uniref:DUF4097 family beta strand repeat-containing protein n=1 Tax=Christiangramia sp. TaxID=1931228 RepID=UPI003242B5D3
MKTIRLNYAFVFLLFIAAGAVAQTKKLSKTYQTPGDVKIEIDSRHTNVIIENWDRNEVQIEAILDGDTGNKENTQKILEAWDLSTSSSNGVVKIKSGGNLNMNAMDMNFNFDMAGLEKPLAQLPAIMEPLMNNLVGPILENIAANPLPPELSENLKSIKFDYDAYKKDGDRYLEKWEAEMDKKFGKDFEVKMEKWAKEMEKDSEKFSKEYEVKMEAWSKDFEKDMEAWGEEFGKKMEAWGEEFGKQMEAQFAGKEAEMKVMEEVMTSKKTIRLKVPKDAKLELNVRHGELKLGSVTKNLKAELSHSRLSANRIEGKGTNIKAAYTPVSINTWEYGVLSTDFVKHCKIDKAVSIKLNSNSSDVVINQLQKTGVLSGSFGKLDINNLGSGFENLNITLENSDLELSIPDAAFNFTYDGTQSKIKYPRSITLKSSKSYDTETLSGYNKSQNANGSISIKANFSDVLVN